MNTSISLQQARQALEEAKLLPPAEEMEALAAAKRGDLLGVARGILLRDSSCRFEFDARADACRFAAEEVLNSVHKDPQLALSMLHVLRQLPGPAASDWWKNDAHLWRTLVCLPVDEVMWKEVVGVWAKSAALTNTVAKHWEIAAALEAGLPRRRWQLFFDAMDIEENAEAKIDSLFETRTSVREQMLRIWAEGDAVSLEGSWRQGDLGVADLSRAITTSLQHRKVPLPGLESAARFFPLGDIVSQARGYQGWLAKLVEIYSFDSKPLQQHEALMAFKVLANCLRSAPKEGIWEKSTSALFHSETFICLAGDQSRWKALLEAFGLTQQQMVILYGQQGTRLSGRLVNYLAVPAAIESAFEAEAAQFHPLPLGPQLKRFADVLMEKESSVHPPSQRLSEMAAIFHLLLKYAAPAPENEHDIQDFLDMHLPGPLPQALRASYHQKALDQQAAPAPLAPRARM